LRAERLRAEARRRAEVARLEAIARQRAIEEAMRANVQSMIERDDVIGEDPEIRRVAVNALGHHAGTVVVMDPRTGRVYAVVNQQWALREGFKPCSTIKLVTGLAGLNERIIDPANTSAISNTNRVDLTSALAQQSPDTLYGPLFQNVQMHEVFPDQKAFVDCVPTRKPSEIMADYQRLAKEPSFHLKAFVTSNFTRPPDPDDITTHIKKLWRVLRRDPSKPVDGSSLLPLPYSTLTPACWQFLQFREG
jgi:hypothetical protein